MRSLVIAISGLNLFVGPVLAVGLVLRTDDAGWGAGSLGLFQALVGAGAAVGAIIAVRWRPSRPARTGLLMLVGQAAACAGVGVAPYAGIAAAMLVIGLTAGLASALVSGAFQRTVDGAYLGRTSSMLALGDNVLMPLAMSGFGVLAAPPASAWRARSPGAGSRLSCCGRRADPASTTTRRTSRAAGDDVRA